VRGGIAPAQPWLDGGCGWRGGLPSRRVAAFSGQLAGRSVCWGTDRGFTWVISFGGTDEMLPPVRVDGAARAATGERSRLRTDALWVRKERGRRSCGWVASNKPQMISVVKAITLRGASMCRGRNCDSGIVVVQMAGCFPLRLIYG
jgi:hypothetical protein